MNLTKIILAILFIAIAGVITSQKLLQPRDSGAETEPSDQRADSNTAANNTNKINPESQASIPGPPDLDIKLQQKDLVAGSGKQASEGRRVQVHVIMKLSDGKVVFDTYQQGKPWDGVVGDSRFIKGLDQGIRGMFQGGKRALWIPSYLAFGTFGINPHVPPHSKVYAEVELISVF